jgi:hypothetical protein
MIRLAAPTASVVPLAMPMLSACVAQITGLQNAKVVVYGYADNEPVGPQLQRTGINDNLPMSSRGTGDVVTCLVSQGGRA